VTAPTESRFKDPTQWTHRRTSGGLPYHDGESYLHLPDGLAIVHRGRNPVETAKLARYLPTHYGSVVMEMVIVPLGPYLAGANPTEVTTTWSGQRFHIGGYYGLKSTPFQETIADVLREIRRSPKYSDASAPRGWRTIEWAV
jgi:hypothetical protein